MSEVGFEPGTFRSCVAHSIHYATETPPIPDVLLVLVAPKHIHRNVTTTLQSRFTPTPPHRPHTRALFYFILFYFILFYFILFYFILFYFILFYFILFYFILFYFILFYFILFYFILFYFILFYFILFYFIFVKLLNTSHSSPKFGLYRFFNIFLQNPYLLTWRIWRKNGFFP